MVLFYKSVVGLTIVAKDVPEQMVITNQ